MILLKTAGRCAMGHRTYVSSTQPGECRCPFGMRRYYYYKIKKGVRVWQTYLLPALPE